MRGQSWEAQGHCPCVLEKSLSLWGEQCDLGEQEDQVVCVALGRATVGSGVVRLWSRSGQAKRSESQREQVMG